MKLILLEMHLLFHLCKFKKKFNPQVQTFYLNRIFKLVKFWLKHDINLATNLILPLLIDGSSKTSENSIYENWQ